MATGFTFRGKHSGRDIGVTVRTVSRPVLPRQKEVTEDIPYMDSVLEYTDAGGRAYYQDKVLEIEISVVEDDLKTLQKKISKVASWLNGGFGHLIFDDMPYICWIALPVDVDGIAPELARVGKTIVQFRCRPFNELIFSSDGIPLDCDIPLDSDIKIGFGEENEADLTNGENIITLDYIGTAPVRAVLHFEGAFSAVSVALEEKQLTFHPPSPVTLLDIDCATYTCICGAVDMTKYSDGEYPELHAGENELHITCIGSGTLRLKYNYKYLYGDEGFDEAD